MGLEVMDSGPSAATGQISPRCQSQFRNSTQHLNRALVCLPTWFVVTSDTGLQGTEVSLLHSDFFKKIIIILPMYIAHMVNVVKCFQYSLEDICNCQFTHPIHKMGTDQIFCRT